MSIPDTFSAIVVSSEGQQQAEPRLATLAPADLPPGEVVVRVAYSSLNYKDALACQGHPGVVNSLPHVPGIDCAGEIAESTSPDYQVGDAVLITGYGLGAPAWGGLSQYARVPAEWVVPMPAGLNARSAMVYGTAGFTAAQCVDALVRHGVTPESGPVCVTGGTGGVGVVALAVLAKLGYEVTVVSGKQEHHDTLQALGAYEVVGRDALDSGDSALLKARWAGAVDTVGGAPLASLLRSTHHRGCVAACGLVAGDQLSLTVMPFILRGVTLCGIDSAKCPRGPREEMWRLLSGDWKVDLPDAMVGEVTLDEVPAEVEKLLAGRHVGRTVVRVG